MQNESQINQDNYKKKFRALVKQSQERIESIEINAKYLRRENEELKLENELLNDQE